VHRGAGRLPPVLLLRRHRGRRDRRLGRRGAAAHEPQGVHGAPVRASLCVTTWRPLLPCYLLRDLGRLSLAGQPPIKNGAVKFRKTARLVMAVGWLISQLTRA
jgi:hypothetical protein